MTPGSNGASPMTQDTLDEAVRLLTEVVVEPQAPQELPPGLAGQLALRELFEMMHALRAMVNTLRQGDLDHQIVGRGYCVGALKALQANLRHVTWQAQQVAAGDLSQRVDFMGEFSEAFNTMVDRIAESRAQLEQLATVDPLTGLLNRRHFFTMAQSEWERSKRQGHTLCLMMLDLDHFKRINDTYGHALGDAVLASVSATCADNLRRADVIGRYGGEELIILLPETRLEAALMVANRLRAEIAQTPIDTDQGRIAITASIGLATDAPAADSETPSDDGLAEMIVQADAALYRAKHEGRNTVRVYTADDDGR